MYRLPILLKQAEINLKTTQYKSHPTVQTPVYKYIYYYCQNKHTKYIYIYRYSCWFTTLPTDLREQTRGYSYMWQEIHPILTFACVCLYNLVHQISSLGLLPPCITTTEQVENTIRVTNIYSLWPCGVVVASLPHKQEDPGSAPGRGSYLRQVSLH